MSHVHGTYTAFARRGCRCDRCREYQRSRVARSRAERLDSGRVNHGSAGWDDGCRCATCRNAHQQRHADYADRKRKAADR